MPALYILTGSNGAGKSSVGPKYLPSNLRDSIFDGDKLFMRKKGELWNSGLKVVKECNRIASDFVEDQFRRLYSAALEKNLDFAYEGHFTNDASWTVPKMFKKSKYELNIIFFGLTDTSLSKARVIEKGERRGPQRRRSYAKGKFLW